MKKVSESESRVLSGGAHYAYVDCPCLAAGECTKKYSDKNGKKGKFKHKFYTIFDYFYVWYSAYLSVCHCEATDVGLR